MYHRYFGLQEAPFSIAVNPRYLFMSARHRDALAHLLYGVGAGGGFILLTGEVGTGKTTVNKSLLEQIPENTDIALILNPALNAVELLATVCDELGIAYHSSEQSLKPLTDKLHQFLLDNHANGRNTVLLIDEAQHLQCEVLEQIRLLTNLETNTKKLLQIILVGQPELRTMLNKPELRQLAQRITARYQLKPLNLAETDAYIRHRLQVAGLPANQTLFPKKIVKGIHAVSRGVPRIINVLCEHMLLGTYGQNKTMVDRAMLKQAITEVMGEKEAIKHPASIFSVSVIAITAALLIAAAVWWPLPPIIDDKPNIIEPVADIIAAPAVAQPIWINSEQQAVNELLAVLELDGRDLNLICNSKQQSSPRCERLKVKTWQALMEYNLPVVLSLVTPAKMQAYAILTGIKNQQATVSLNHQISSVPLTILGELWTGDFLLVWSPPPAYTGPFSTEYSGPMVKWLAEQFAEIDGQSSLLAEDSFNSVLLQRVKIFSKKSSIT